MKKKSLIPSAVLFEDDARTSAGIIKSLNVLGIAVRALRDVIEFVPASEGLVLIGPHFKQAKRQIALVRAARPEALILKLLSKSNLATKVTQGEDAQVPLPISTADLRLRLPELIELHRNRRMPGIDLIDRVTGFYSFGFFKELLFVELKRARRFGLHLSLVMIDLDDSKDAPGSARHRDLMAEMSRSVRSSLRETDYPVQFNPSRALVLMPHTDLPGAVTVATRICERAGRADKMTLSVGASALRAGEQVSFAELVRRTQSSLERAQSAGGNRVEFFDAAEVK